MPDVLRNIKSFGTRTFVGERAAAPGNKAPILSSEVDADFNTIYDAWNNLAIDPAQLPPNLAYKPIQAGDIANDAIRTNHILNGTIKGEDLDPNLVLPTSVVIPPNSIGPAQLVDTAFVTVIDNITVGATVKDQKQVGSDVDEGTLIPPNVETIIAETTWTTRGGFWIAWGFVNGAVLVSNPADDVTAQLRFGATGAGNIAGSTVIQRHMIHLTASQPDPINIFVPYAAALIHSAVLSSQAAARLQLTMHHTRGQLLISSKRLVVMEQA
jgi:hypothetical protein